MKNVIQEIRPKVMEIFEYLHLHPEISWKEVQTTEYITNFFKSYGCKVTTFDECTGVVAETGDGSPL